MAQRTHEGYARSRGGPAQKRCGYAPKWYIKGVDADRHERKARDPRQRMRQERSAHAPERSQDRARTGVEETFPL
jgi:hypothetical protein